MRDYFGHDPELPAGFQEADFEMRELEAKAREVRRAEVRAKIAGATFEQWRAWVDSWCYKLAGCSVDDLPDWDFRSAFESHQHPKSAARAVIAAARE